MAVADFDLLNSDFLKETEEAHFNLNETQLFDALGLLSFELTQPPEEQAALLRTASSIYTFITTSKVDKAEAKPNRPKGKKKANQKQKRLSLPPQTLITRNLQLSQQNLTSPPPPPVVPSQGGNSKTKVCSCCHFSPSS